MSFHSPETGRIEVQQVRARPWPQLPHSVTVKHINMLGIRRDSQETQLFAVLSRRFLKSIGKNLPPLTLFISSSLLLLPGSNTAIAQRSSNSSPSVVEPGAPGQPTRVLPRSTHAAMPHLSQADVAFMQGMIMHHSQAVEMTALIPSHTTDQDVRSLGAKISSSQSDEIAFMKRWLAARGEPVAMAMTEMPGMDRKGEPMAPMPGMLTPQQMAALRRAKGEEFDRLFLTGMIQHHNGALVMVKDLFDTPGAGEDAELFDFATDADNSQRAEIKIMQGMLEKEAVEENR
jgi:uncharacterized protein (DUF305 family)